MAAVELALGDVRVRATAVPGERLLAWAAQCPQRSGRSRTRPVWGICRLSSTPGKWLMRHGPGYRFNAAPEVLDLSSFRRAAAAARSSVAVGDDATALQHRIEVPKTLGCTGDLISVPRFPAACRMPNATVGSSP
jgi:hypothetical protein